jgi:hypothetical protein
VAGTKRPTQRPFSTSGSPPLCRILSCTSSIMASSSAFEHRVASSVTTLLCVTVSPEKRTSVCVGLPNPRSASHRPAGLPSYRERGSAGRACCSRPRDRQRLGRDTALACGQRVDILSTLRTKGAWRKPGRARVRGAGVPTRWRGKDHRRALTSRHMSVAASALARASSSLFGPPLAPLRQYLRAMLKARRSRAR